MTLREILLGFGCALVAGTLVALAMHLSGVAFRATVQPNSTVVANFTFGTGNGTLPSMDKAGLCAAAGLVLSGSIEDSLAGRSEPVPPAPAFQVSCP